jgi:cyclophilin family peptidyl-prolyl cis-trans isomerase/HEAT repeat protein
MRVTINILFFVLAISLSNIPVSSQSLTEDMKKILTYGDTRSLGPNNELLEFLNSGDEEIVTAALYALSGISDSTSIDEINTQLINNPSPKVREMAAFALGQIGTQTSADYLLDALGKEKETAVLAAILEGIGKSGDEETLDKLPKISLDNPEYLSSLAMSVARFALRNIKNASSTGILEALFSQKEPEVEKSIAYALWRIRDRDLLLPERNRILDLLSSQDHETRSYAVYAFSVIKEPGDVPFLIDLFNREPDWRVRVNILNTVGSYSLDSVKQYTVQIEDLIESTLTDPTDHVKIAALEADGKLFSQYVIPPTSGNKPAVIPGTRIPYRIIGSGGWFSYQVRGAAIDAYAKILKDDARNVLWEEFYYSSLTLEIIKAFGYFEDGDIIRQIRDSVSAYVVRYNQEFPDTTGAMIPTPFLGKLYLAYIETAIALLPKMKSEESLNLARLSFIEFADSRKPNIVYYSLQGLQTEQMKAREDWTFENKQVLNFEYAGLNYPEDVDVMTLFAETFGELKDTAMLDELRKNISRDSYDLAKSSADAIEKITGEKINIDPDDYARHTDFDWDYLSSHQNSKVILKTDEGDIELELYPDAAPFTVMNFLKLAEKNYFDGTEFHRVIGNFVIQGGDPTSTGFGGPGYSIRGEYSPLPYERGTLGMASSGKDTEGSQFFITHSRTPHLDSKYTIFGKVTSGMEIVDRILIGNKLNDVIIINN